jgi:hypothetical protein
MKYVVDIAPFISKRTSQWNFKLGTLLSIRIPLHQLNPFLSRCRFGFNIEPTYLISLQSGRQTGQNTPEKIIEENPFPLATVHYCTAQYKSSADPFRGT